MTCAPANINPITAPINLNLITAPVLPPPKPGLEIWHRPQHEIANLLKTDEDRFHFYHVDMIIEEIYSCQAGEYTDFLIDSFLLLNASNLQKSIDTGCPFRLISPDPWNYAKLAIMFNTSGLFSEKQEIEIITKTLIWDKDNPQETDQAKQTFNDLLNEGFRSRVKFDENTESITMNRRRCIKKERSFLSMKGMFDEAKNLKLFLSLSAEARKEKYGA